MTYDADDPLPCKMEVIRQWRERCLNSLGQPRLRIWYSIKNVGTHTCGAEIDLAWVVNDA